MARSDAGLPNVFNHENRSPLIDWFLRLGDVRHPGAAWSFGEEAFEFFERDRVSDGVDFHAAVPAVLHVARDAELVGPTLREVAEAHALYPTRNEVFSCDFHEGETGIAFSILHGTLAL